MVIEVNVDCEDMGIGEAEIGDMIRLVEDIGQDENIPMNTGFPSTFDILFI